MKASKLTARGLAYVVRAVGRKIAKAHRAKQTPHGKQTVKKLMAHGTSTNSLELSGDTKLFDRVARKWNVDYAFYQTEPGKYLLFFKSGQADAMTACFSEYSRKVLDKAKSRQPTIPEQMKQAEQQLAKEKPPKEHIKEVTHGDRYTNAKHPQRIYSCKTYNAFGKHHCSQHRIEYDTLTSLVLHKIRECAAAALMDSEAVADRLTGNCEAEQKGQREAMERALAKDEERIETLEKMVLRLYEDMVCRSVGAGVRAAEKAVEGGRDVRLWGVSHKILPTVLI